MVFPNKYSVQCAQDFSLSVSPVFNSLGANRSAFTCDRAVYLCTCTLELPGICACPVDFLHSSDSSDCTWGRTLGRIWKRWQKKSKMGLTAELNDDYYLSSFGYKYEPPIIQSLIRQQMWQNNICIFENRPAHQAEIRSIRLFVISSPHLSSGVFPNTHLPLTYRKSLDIPPTSLIPGHPLCN